MEKENALYFTLSRRLGKDSFLCRASTKENFQNLSESPNPMDARDYRSSRSGRLEFHEGHGIAYRAFVPESLPPADLSYTVDLVAGLSDADAALGELAGVGRQLPNPHVLIASYVRREAVLSSRIEGTQASLSDVFEDELLHAEAVADAPDVQEVRNYVTALEYGVAQVAADRTLSLDLVLELHGHLMAGVRGQDKQPGEFRQAQNWIGHPGSTPLSAIFVPPHPSRLEEVLADWSAFVQDRAQRVPPLIACALMHQQFETIHPFRDGNGRVGRLLIPLFLLDRGRLTLPLLYLSAYIEEHKTEYARRLQRVRTDGEWEEWLQFFLGGVAATAREAGTRARDITDYYERARDAAAGNPNSVRLLREMLRNPFMSAPRAAEVLAVSAPTARRAIEDLRKLDLVQEAPKRGRTPLFVARGLLDLFSRPAS